MAVGYLMKVVASSVGSLSELVTLRLQLRAHAAIQSMLVGFVVKDKQGQPLFGENTHDLLGQSSGPGCARGLHSKLYVPHASAMPSGDYAISVAVSDGTRNSMSCTSGFMMRLSFLVDQPACQLVLLDTDAGYRMDVAK
jgi:hypothetical protein